MGSTMKKLISIISTEQFWIRLGGATLLMFALQSFLLSLWALPLNGYQIPYMGEVTISDLFFIVIFSLLFGLAVSLFTLGRSYNTTTCVLGTGSGMLSLFSMLCPVCPVFFLAYFGLSATLLSIAPYFLAIRLLALALLGLGLFILIRNFEPRNLPQQKPHYIFQKIAMIVVGLLLIVNQTFAMNIGMALMGPEMNGTMKMSGKFAQDVAMLVTPTEVPFYGQELGLDMSNINAINTSIKKLSTMAPMQGSNPIQLNEEEMKRYIDIGTEPYVTCEFCCGVTTLVREDGSPTCGCAHSIAMRGTVAYLIRNHPNLTNEEISYELMRQKGMYFPGQMQERMAQSLAGDVSNATADIKYLLMNLSGSELTNLQKQAKSSGFTPPTQSPNMVGGC